MAHRLPRKFLPSISGTSRGGGGGPTGPAGGDLFGTYPNPSVSNDSHSHTSATLPATIVYDGDAAGGDLTGTYPNPTLVAIVAPTGPIGNATTVPVITIDAKGRVTVLGSATITGTAPGGSAGGVLDGTYPNPGLAASVAGAGLAETADVLSVNVDGTSLEIPVDTLRRAALTGDVTAAAGSNITTIANDAVTFGKMLNATAASLLVGRGSGSGGGDFQEITLGSGLSMTGTVLSSSGGSGYTDEQAQDAIGAMIDASLTYVDGTPLLQRSALTGDVAASAGSNTTTLASIVAAAGPIGSATVVPILTIDAKGRVTALSSTTIAGVVPGGAAGGDLSGTYPNPSVVDDSHNHTASTLPATIVYDGDAAGGDLSGTYPNPSVVNDSHTHTNATVTGPFPPNGAAGGDLSGSYPNPSVVDDSHAHTATTLPLATTSVTGVVRLSSDLEYTANEVIRADDIRTLTSLYRVRQGQVMVRFSTSQFQVQFDFVGMRAPTLLGSGNPNPFQTILGNAFVVARFVTSTASGSYAGYLDVPGVNGGLIRTGFNAVCGWVIQTGNQHTDIRYWVGFTNADLHATGSPGAGFAVAAFRYDTGVDTATTNWRTVTTNNVGGTTVTDTGVNAAVTTSPLRFIIQTSITAITFWINEVIVAVHTTNLPTDINLGHTCMVTNIAASANNKRIDFGRAWISHSEFGI